MGTCRQLELYPLGGYRMFDCIRSQLIGVGEVDLNTMTILQSYIKAFGVYTWSSQQPAGAEETYVDSYSFLGNGEGQPAEETQAEIAATLSGFSANIEPEGYEPGVGILNLATTIGPVCPVAQPGQACEDRPYQALLRIADPEGNEIQQFTTDHLGRALVFLKPGQYIVEPVNQSTLPFAQPIGFQVSEASEVQLLLPFDSGIR